MEIDLNKTDEHGFSVKLQEGKLLLAREFIGDYSNEKILVTIQRKYPESVESFTSKIYTYKGFSYTIQRDDFGYLVLEVL